MGHITLKKNTDIEALRAIGILFVLFAHIHELFPWWNPVFARVYRYLDFWTGVDLFFCVSGFIITRSILREVPEGGGWRAFVSFAVPFWVRRVWRLLPSAWFWLCFILAASVLFNEGGYFGAPGRNFVYQVYSMLNMANFYGYYCKLNGACGANQVYWSLSLEEQFYLVFPVLLFLVPRRFWAALFLGIAAIQLPLDRGGSLLGFVRTDAIALGVVVALWKDHPSYRMLEPVFLGNRAKVLGSTALLALLLAALGASGVVAVPMSTGMVAVLSAAMVFLASFDRGYIVPRGWVAAVAEYVGSRSYALYLSHIPAFFVTKELWLRFSDASTKFDSTDTLRFLATGLPMMLLFAELSYRLIEVPFRNRGRAIAPDIQARMQAAT